jgi:acyl-CoA synthetase (NDP forming)
VGATHDQPGFATPDLAPLLTPRALAVIGASPDVEIIRGRLMHLLLARGFPGPIYPITRRHREVFGRPAYASIGDVPGPVDLAIIVIPADGVPEAIDACGRHGVKAAIVISSGFAEERGERGRDRQERVREIAARHGMLVCGPNSEGIANLLAPMIATFTPVLEDASVSLVPDVPRGRTLAVVAQSGGIAFAFFNRGRPRQLRFSYLVSTGNEAGVDTLDYVSFMLDEGLTDIFLLYVETLRSAWKLGAVAARAARAGKPIVVAKVGHSDAGRRAALSHTGALAGADDAYAAMFRHHGIVRADDMDDMLDIAAAFALCPPARGRQVALVSASGGGAVWMSDVLSAHGLRMPVLDPPTREAIDALIPSYGASHNPVDVTAQAVRQVGYARLIEILLASPVVDHVVVVASLASETVIARDLENLRRVAATADKPVLFCTYTTASARALMLLADAGLPVFTRMAGCARAIRALAEHAEFQARAARPTPAFTAAADVRAEAAARLRAAPRVLAEHEAKAVLAAYGVPRPAEVLTKDEDAAAAAARRIGYPVALKVQSPDIPHKTEAGAIALDIRSESALREAYRQITAAARTAVPDAAVDGVLVQRMAPPGVEMLLGVARDPDFGPMLVVGLGGIHVELLRDTVTLPVPARPDDVREALGRLRGAALLGPLRGRPAADVGALVDLVVRLGGFAADHAGAIAEIDLNPVIVHADGQGVSVVDALMTLAPHVDTRLRPPFFAR